MALEAPAGLQFDRSEIMTPRITLEDILAVQSLAMGFLRFRARTRRNNSSEHRHGFSMYEPGTGDVRAVEDIYDGTVDAYLTCSVRKVEYDQWRMRVSFLSMLMTKETKRMNVRENYEFDWLRNGNRMAWAWTVQTDQTESGKTVLETYNVHPIETDEIDEVRVRMVDMSERVNPLQAGSFMDGGQL